MGRLESLKAWAGRLKTELRALYLAYGDPRVPTHARVLAIVVVAYAFSPIDLIPDPIISVVIGVLILGSSWKLLRESTNILLESTPKDVDAEKVGRKMASVPGVEEVHDLHIWTITSGFPALAAHVLVGASENCHDRRRDIEAVLARDFGIEHTTLQVDHAGDHQASLQSLRFPARRD